MEPRSIQKGIEKRWKNGRHQVGQKIEIRRSDTLRGEGSRALGSVIFTCPRRRGTTSLNAIAHSYLLFIAIGSSAFGLSRVILRLPHSSASHKEFQRRT